MAADITTKQQNFVSQFVTGVLALLDCNDTTLEPLVANWNANAYATGATPTSSNITDAVLNGTPNTHQYMTAVQLNQAEGALVAVMNVISSNRGYLEAMRP